MITQLYNKLINRKFYIVLFSIALVFFIRGLFSVYFSDDLLYSLYIDKNTAHFGSDFTPRYFTNILEIIPSQWNHYLYTNGRALCHILVQLFNGFIPQWCYALFLAICNVLLVYLCVAVANVPKNYKSYFLVFLFTWIAFPQYITPCVGIGYTFSAVLILSWIYAFLYYIRGNYIISKNKSLFIILFSIICGSTNESLTIGIAGSIFIYFFFNYKKIESKERMFIIAFIIGLCVLCFAPGSLRRFLWNSNNTFDIQVLFSNKIETLLSIAENLSIFYIWIITFLITQKRMYSGYVKDNFYYLTSIVITFCFTLAVGYINPRQLYMVELLSIVLIVRILMTIKINKLILAISMIFLYVHLLFVSIFTIKLFKHNDAIVKQYIESETGIVNINEISIPVSLKHYVSKLVDNDTDWWYSYCLKKYYNKEVDLTIKYTNLNADK